MMKIDNNFSFNDGTSKETKIIFVKNYLLALEPINKVNYKKDIKKITANFVEDPVYQLK